MTRKLEIPDFDDLVARYLAGTSFLQLSKESGIGRNVLTNAFKRANIPLRTASEQERIKWSLLKTDRAKVVRQMQGSWLGRRGQKDSLEVKIRRAHATYTRLKGVGKWESEIVTLLRARGLNVLPQLPIGTYNVDFAIDPPRIAVEVQTAWLRGGKSTKPERLNYILDQGWTLVIVYLPKRGPVPTIPLIAEKLHALAELRSSDPTLAGQYLMIGSNAKCIAPEGFNLDGRTRIASF